MRLTEDPLFQEWGKLLEETGRLVDLIRADNARKIYRLMPWVVWRVSKRLEKAEANLALSRQMGQRLREDYPYIFGPF